MDCRRKYQPERKLPERQGLFILRRFDGILNKKVAVKTVHMSRITVRTCRGRLIYIGVISIFREIHIGRRIAVSYSVLRNSTVLDGIVKILRMMC